MLNQDYEFRTGDTFHSDWFAVIIAGDPVDLSSGWLIRSQIRDSLDEVIADLGINLGTATITVDGVPVEASAVRIHIPATASRDAGSFVASWDLEITHPTYDDGDLYRKTIAGGMIRSRRDVTR